MARASVYSLLSLDRYAKIMGINPVHFAGCSAGSFFPLQNACSDIWFQHSWQFADSVSREDLARALLDAEEDLAQALGYYPAPKWIAQEVHKFDHHHRPDVWRGGARNVRGERLSMRTDYAKVIQAGQRTVSLIGTATTAGGTLTYTDADLDGFVERATISLPTTLTTTEEIKVYHSGQGAAQEWEIRDAWYASIAGGTLEIRFYVWQMVLPELWERFPTSAGPSAIDLTNTDNLVASVEVYRESTDSTATSATFVWEPTAHGLASWCVSCGGTGCPACAFTEQDGCLHVRNANLGIVVPEPASYDTDSAEWHQDSYLFSRDPDFVRLYYYAGHLDNRYRRGVSDSALSDHWAHALAWIATARLERPFCSCGNVAALGRRLQEDLSAVSSTERQAQSYRTGQNLLDNPLGPRRGEVQAWQRVLQARDRIVGGGVA